MTRSGSCFDDGGRADTTVEQAQGPTTGLTRQRQLALLFRSALQRWLKPASALGSFAAMESVGSIAEILRSGASFKARPPVPTANAKAPGPVAAARDEGPPRPPDWTHAEEARPAQLRACAAAQAGVDGLIRELRVARVSPGSEASAIRSDKRFGSEAIGDCDCYPRRWMIRGHWNPRRLRFRGPEAIAIRGDFRFRCRCDPRPLESEAIGIRGNGNPVGPDSNPIRL